MRGPGVWVLPSIARGILSSENNWENVNIGNSTRYLSLQSDRAFAFLGFYFGFPIMSQNCWIVDLDPIKAVTQRNDKDIDMWEIAFECLNLFLHMRGQVCFLGKRRQKIIFTPNDSDETGFEYTLSFSRSHFIDRQEMQVVSESRYNDNLFQVIWSQAWTMSLARPERDGVT